MHRKKMRNKLKNLKSTNPKEYWQILNNGRERKQPDIPLEELFEFFKNLNKAPEEPQPQARSFNLDDIDMNHIDDQLNCRNT